MMLGYFITASCVCTVGIDGGGLSAASKCTQRDLSALAGILSGTTNYRVFLIFFVTCNRDKTPQVKKRVVGKSIILSVSDDLPPSFNSKAPSDSVNEKQASDSQGEKKANNGNPPG
ncbi:hypothetical protein Y032_0045g1203 [Ancylostoma ceylanicum]|nr:hypothetical protein Y032_0045g1203 [Ancylostoma ceylanicum]